jgi:type II secretory pathway pseudopilin PulG
MTMNPCAILRLSGPQGRRQSGVALIAWIGVVAVIAIGIAFLLPALLREIDYSVARSESATLKTLGNALQTAIQHQSYIPYQGDWHQRVSAETGMALASITNNPRNKPRILVIDTNGWFGTELLPYTQDFAGTTNFPLNARMMIVTSLGASLPISGGPVSASVFSNLWNAADGAKLTTAPWTTWSGQPQDVKVERVNLSPLFVTLRMVTHPQGAPQGLYSIGSEGGVHPAEYQNDQSPTPPRYYIQGTALRLYWYDVPTLTGHLDSTQIMDRDGSFMYENGKWRSSSAGGMMPGGVDISGIVLAFLNSVPNLNAQNGADQQRLVVLSMMNYMSNYIAWANGNFTDNNQKNYLKSTVQPNMMYTVQGLFMGAYYPVNGGACE